jgi:4'-phosphopantetheinyl transferase
MPDLPALAPDAVGLWLIHAPRAQAARRARAIIAHYAGMPEQALDWRVGPHGKPYVANASVHFNLSHSGPATALAISLAGAVGVDLEYPRRIARREALLKRCFTDIERESVLAAHDPDAHLLRLWAGKEAVVKAIGRGIAYGLKNVEVGLDDNDALHLIALHGTGGPAERWQLQRMYLRDDAYLGVCAQRGAHSCAGSTALQRALLEVVYVQS